FPIYSLHYSQILVAWALVLWTAVVLVAASGLVTSLVLLTTSLLVVPTLIWGSGFLGAMLTSSFYSNPNSILDWPLGLLVTCHLAQRVHDRHPPLWSVAVLIPAASLFFKVNDAFAFAFLTAAAIVVCAVSAPRQALALAAAGATSWVAAFAAARAMARWPVSEGVRASVENFWHYAGAAVPAFTRRDPMGVISAALAYLVIVAAVVVLSS